MPPKKNSGEKKKTVNTRKKKVSSEKKIDSGEKKVSSEKKISSSKKPTKSSIHSYIKIIAQMMIFILLLALSPNILIDNTEEVYYNFIRYVIVVFILGYIYNAIDEIPIKVDSKNNVIKSLISKFLSKFKLDNVKLTIIKINLGLSKFKLYIKKLLSVVNPIIFYLGSAMTLITAIIFIKTFIEIADKYNYSITDKMGIYDFITELYRTNITVYKALKDISYEDFYNNSIVSLIKNYYPANKIKEIIAIALKYNEYFIKFLHSSIM